MYFLTSNQINIDESIIIFKKMQRFYGWQPAANVEMLLKRKKGSKAWKCYGSQTNRFETNQTLYENARGGVAERKALEKDEGTMCFGQIQ